MMYLFGLIWKPSRSLKIYVSDHEYVVNLDPSVKTLIFGLESISTMRCGIYEDAMKEYGLGPNNEILDGFRGSDTETKPLQYVFINQKKKTFGNIVGVEDLCKSDDEPKHHIVLPGKRKIVGVEDILDKSEDFDQFDDRPPFSVDVDTSILLSKEDAPYLRCDHDQGTFVKRKITNVPLNSNV